MIETGKVTNVYIGHVGSELSADIALGVTVLPVEDAFDFSEDGGQLMIGGATLVYVAADPDTDTVTLAAPTTAAYTGGTDVFVVPLGSQKFAMVEFDDGDEGVVAVIPYAMAPIFTDGIRDYGDQEAVQVSDETGRWEIRTVEDEEPVIDGTYMDATTVPTPIATAVPATSPEIEVTGTVDSFVLRPTDDIAPGTLIQWHVSKTPVFVAGPATQFGPATAAVGVITSLPNFEAFEPGVKYYFQAVAQNSVGVSPDASSEVEAMLNPEVVSKLILTQLIAGFILANKIQLGTESGAYLSGVDGIVLPQPDGTATRFPVDGITPATIAGYLMAIGATFNGDVDFFQLVRMFGTMRLASGIPNPSAKAGLSRRWDHLQWSEPGTLGNDWVHGLCQRVDLAGDWATVSAVWDVSFCATINKVTGERWGAYPGQDAWKDNFLAVGGITSIGSFYYVLGWDRNRGGNWYIYKLDNTFAKVHEVLFANAGLPTDPAIGTDGTNILITFSSGTNVWIRKHDPAVFQTTGAYTQKTYITGATGRNWGGVYVGLAGHTSVNAYMASQTPTDPNVFALTDVATPAADTPRYFPRAGGAIIRGLWWDGTRFYSIDDNGRIWEYGAGHETQSNVDGAYAWFDGDATGGMHETMPSPLGAGSQNFLWPARSIITIDAQAAPDEAVTDPAKTDKANLVRFYLAPTGGTLRIQGTGVLGQRSLDRETMDTGSTPAKVVNEFDLVPGTLGSWETTASDAISKIAYTRGDGEGRAGPLKWDKFGKNISGVELALQTVNFTSGVTSGISYPAGLPEKVFVAPASGRVLITFNAFIRAGAVGSAVVSGVWPEVKTGGVVRSGTGPQWMTQGELARFGLGHYDNNFLRAGSSVVISGLVPGDTYNCYWAVNTTGANALVQSGAMQITPIT